MKTVIANGKIIDGTGKTPYCADILIDRDTIQDIGNFSALTDVRRIDAAGLCVTPGLIDAHTHAELSLMQNRQQPNAIYQGISTMITGQCGLGFVPMRPEQMESSLRMNSGIFGCLPERFPRWTDYPSYHRLLDGCAVNAGVIIPHNAIRQWSSGFDNVPLTGDRLAQSKEALDTALRQGALGFSVGLSYYPGGYSDTQELIELCKVVKEHDGVFCVHMRLDVHNPEFEPMAEIARVAEETGVRTNLLHHRTGSMAEECESVMAPFRRAQRMGTQVTFEYYPYLVGSGLVLAVIPEWAQEGGADRILETLTSPKCRDRLMKDLAHRYPFFFPNGATGRIYWTKDPYDDARGRTIDEIAAMRGESVLDTVIHLLVENDLEVGFNGVEYQSAELAEKLYDDQYKLFLDPDYTIGSDSIPTGGLSHPRSSGAFVRIIRMMRERGVPAETVIRKLSGKPAEIYGLADRGTIEIGKKADICIMDYDHVYDGADFSFSRRRPTGIRTLLVNGLPVMQDETLTGELSGRAIHRSARR